MKKTLLLLLAVFTHFSSAHADPCRPFSVSVAVDSFNVTVGKICNDDDSASFYIGTTSAKGKEVKVSAADTNALSANHITSAAWNSCISAQIASGKGLSDVQRGTVDIAASVVDDPAASMDDAKLTLAQVCAAN